MVQLRNREISPVIIGPAHNFDPIENQIALDSVLPSPRSQAPSDLHSNMSGEASPNDNTNPYAFNIDLKEKIGSSLFLSATKGLDDDDKISLSVDTAVDFKAEVDRSAADFCWGTVCSDISIGGGNSKDLLEQYNELTLLHVKAHADATWGCTTNDNKIPRPGGGGLSDEAKQRRIRSTMMAKWIRNSLTKDDQKILDLKKRVFQYKHDVKKTIEEDGPLMLKLIYDRINPSTRVGVRNLISALFRFNLGSYDQNVPKMADAFKRTYNQIVAKGDETVKPEGPFFDALLTCANNDFTTGIKAELTKWESGSNMSFDTIKDDAITKYNNICERLKKEGKSFSGGDLTLSNVTNRQSSGDQATIVALRAELESTKQKFAVASNAYSTIATKNGGGNGRKPNIDAWRMKKSFGDKVMRDGKWFHWCPHHTYPGFYDGLYVTHPPEKHEEWKERQDKMKGREKYSDKSGGDKNNGSNPTSSSDTRLVLSDSVKQALITDHGFSTLQIDQLLRSSEN